jgi:uncharacterized protein
MLAVQFDTKDGDVKDDAQASGDLDRGPRELRPSAARMCAFTREVKPTEELLRFVMAPTGEAVVDLKHRLPGRGLWITARRETLDQAVRRGIFQKGFKREVGGLSTLADDTERLILRGVCDALAIAAKAGQAVSGAGKVSDLIERDEAAAVIHARDGSEDGIRKLNGQLRAQMQARGREGAVRIVRGLTSDELDLALGRSNVIHAALRAGPASKTFLSRCQTLERFRGLNGADAIEVDAIEDAIEQDGSAGLE